MRPPRRIAAAVVACFFLSGATGLVYEVVWIRMLSLVFGHTVFAVTTVLAAFMGGLGLGSWLFGRVADRGRRVLALYGALEIGIGALCLAVPLVLPAVESAYVALRRATGLSFVAFAAAQFVLVLGLLLPPTTLMGATLPVLSRAFVRDDRSVAYGVGRLYALNTAGAVVGTALAGYVLLPALGVRRTLVLAAAVSILVGVVVLLLDRRVRALAPSASPAAPTTSAVEPALLPDAGRPPPPGVQPAPSPDAGSRWRGRAVVAALGVSGAASMAYEIGWTRALALVIGSSTYAFTAMVVAFLLGLAAGSALFARLAARRRPGAAAFAALQLGIAASALAILPAFERLPDVMLRALTLSREPGFVLATQVTLAGAAMLVPTLLIGATFPCAVAATAGGASRVAADVGRIYAVNTLGAIAGIVTAGFGLMPAFGAQATLRIAVAANAATALALLAGVALAPGGRRRAAVAALAAGVVVAGVLVVPRWDPAVMASGVAVYARQYESFAGRVPIAEAFPDRRVLHYRDGLGATVSVHADGATRLLRVNGKTDASTGLDMHTQLMLGHLPLLAHPGGERVLVIGLGSGITAGAVIQHPVQHVDVVEIEPAVVEASRFFARENRRALEDPRVRVTVADARNFLLATQSRYDVIVSEPSNPWIGGIATLFTREFYALAASRLAPGGVMLQWIDGYTMHPDDLRMVVRTFTGAFADVSVWNAHGADFLLLGRTTRAPWDLARMDQTVARAAGVREDLTRLGFMEPAAVLADFVLGGDDVTRYADGAAVNDDDRLPLEFSAPRSLYRDTALPNLRLLRRARTLEWPSLTAASARRLQEPATLHALGVAYLAKAQPADARRHFERALAADPRRVETMIELGRAWLSLGDGEKAAAALERALTVEPAWAEAQALLARAWRAQGAIARAVTAAQRAVAAAPARLEYRVLLGETLVANARASEAVGHFLAARHAAPADPRPLPGLAAAYLALGRAADAVVVLEEAVAREPGDVRLRYQLGRAYMAANRPGEALGALRRAARAMPEHTAIWTEVEAARAAAGH